MLVSCSQTAYVQTVHPTATDAPSPASNNKDLE